jgi:periplasmic protein TonB
MDRARVVCPSISFAAHFTGATILGLAFLFLPERLPLRSLPEPGGPWPRVDLGRAPGGGTRGRVARPTVRPPSHPLLPAIVPPIEIDPMLDRGEGRGIEGFPGVGGGGTGDGPDLCLSDCGGGGVGKDVGTTLPPLEKKERKPIVMKGGDLRAPAKLRDVAPVYPPLALSARLEGQVTLACVIDERGRVTSVSVVRGHPLFDAAAVAAVGQWRYNPPLLNGEPVSVLLEVIVDFRLR